MGAPLLELKHVTILRGECAALDDVTLTIGQGEHVCILGPNGCGKSTLIKLLTRELYPLAREGSSIAILGRERWNVFELRNLLGIVSPDLLAQCSTDATGRDVVLSRFFSSTRIFPHHRPGSGMDGACGNGDEATGHQAPGGPRGGADVQRRSETHVDRVGAGPRTESAAFRRTGQRAGPRGAVPVAGHAAGTGAVGAGDSADHAPRFGTMFRRSSRKSSGWCCCTGADSGRRRQG